VQVQTVPVQIDRPPDLTTLPLPRPVELHDVEFTVVPRGQPAPRTLVGLSVNDYEKLALNFAELARWAREAMFQLRYYRRDEVER